MTTYNLTGKDAIILNNNLLTDFADGDVVNVAFPNDLINIKTGKNGNTIFAENATGQNVDVELRIMRGSADDKTLNSLFATQSRDFSAFTLLVGQFTQRSGDGAANVSRIVYDLKGGVFKRNLDGKSNVEGETEQGVALYRLSFANGSRSIQ